VLLSLAVTGIRYTTLHAQLTLRSGKSEVICHSRGHDKRSHHSNSWEYEYADVYTTFMV